MSLLSSLPPVESIEQAENNPQTQEQSAPNPFARDILFVATNLDSWKADDVRFGYEVMLDVCYRQLDAPYYAWLRNKMSDVKRAHDSGKMKADLYEELRARFNTIHEWAIRHIGEKELLKAFGAIKQDRYVPPSERTFTEYRRREPVPGMPAAGESVDSNPASADLEHSFPSDGDLAYSVRVTLRAKELVDAIRDQALSLGWTEAGLYQNRGRHPFPYGQDYGLICFLSGGRTVGAVTAQSAEIVPPREGAQHHRFYNPYADQPWITASAE